MINQCVNCTKTFKTNERRTKTCSKTCADARRSLSQKAGKLISIEAEPVSLKYQLPPPEELPAPYAKRVHDLWVSLVGDGAPTRIA